MNTIKFSQILYLYPRTDIDGKSYTRVITSDEQYDIYGHIRFDYENKQIEYK